jgi:hypothetical protein
VPPVEPVIGHTKAEHRMGRNYLKARDGNRINAVLAAAGYNFSLLLRWLARLLCGLVRALFVGLPSAQAQKRHSAVLHSRLSRRATLLAAHPASSLSSSEGRQSEPRGGLSGAWWSG